MNTKLRSFAGLATGLALQLCLAAGANPLVTTVTGGASPDVVIPDNSLNGVASTVELTPTFSAITGVTVTLDISGAPYAYDGDYYAYLQYGSTLVTLMSNPGTSVQNPYGSPNNGMTVTFTDAAVTSINAATAANYAPLNGFYAPATPLGAFDGVIPISGYNRLWTLFIADTSPGGVGQLTSWDLSVTGVPDNTSTFALLAMGLGILGLITMRKPATLPISRN